MNEIKYLRKILKISLIIPIFLPVVSYGFNDEFTHPSLSRIAFEKSNLSNILFESQNLSVESDKFEVKGKKFSALSLVRIGAQEEDEPGCRASNHFHNPLATSWDSAELTDNVSWIDWFCKNYQFLYEDKYSTVVWATNMVDKDQTRHNDPSINYVEYPDADDNYGRNWIVARDMYHWALRTEDSHARDVRLAETFRTLGYVMHLLQDMAVPAHTRNDFSKGHMQNVDISWNPTKTKGNPFENYVKNNFQNEIFPAISSNISFPFKGEKRLTNFWDTDTITQTNNMPQTGLNIGLSEYSNTNFFSHNTIFKEESDALHYFPYPNKDSITDPDIPDQIELTLHEIVAKDDLLDSGVYVSKNKHGEYIDKFLTPRYIFYDYKDEENNDLLLRFEYFLDDQCYLDYARNLIPRAIGYSASLLDYFFRGTIDIQHVVPHYGPDLSINRIDFSIKNLTPPIMENQLVEPMSSGFFEVITSYKDPGGTIIRNLVPTNIYAVEGEADLINSEFVSVQIPLVNNIPIDAKELSLTVIFRGRLGYEEGAVAAQIYNFQNGGRIAYYNQPGGPENTSNIFTISPNGSHPYQLTQMIDPNPWYFAPIWSDDGSMLAFEESGCLAEGYDPTVSEYGCPSDDAYREIVITDSGSDLPFPDNIRHRLNHNGASVANPTFSPDGSQVAGLLQNEGGFYYYSNIVTFNVSDGTSRVITNYEGNSISLGNSRPAWSPTGESIAYYVNYMYHEASGSWGPVGDIFLIAPDGGSETNLTNDEFFNLQPAWSPDGNLIAFSSDRDGGDSMDIWLMYKDGTNLIQLYDTEADCYNPTFSPDGRKVAFSNGSSIYTIDIDGDLSSLEEVVTPGLLTGGLEWSSYLSPPSIEVQVSPSTVTPSQQATISWQSEGATEVFIDGIQGLHPPNGTLTVYPDATTTYTITAFGIKGAQESAITVTVE